MEKEIPAKKVIANPIKVLFPLALMDLVFSSSKRKIAVPALILYVGSLSFSKSFELSVYVKRNEKDQCFFKYDNYIM